MCLSCLSCLLLPRQDFVAVDTGMSRQLFVFVVELSDEEVVVGGRDGGVGADSSVDELELEVKEQEEEYLLIQMLMNSYH